MKKCIIGVLFLLIACTPQSFSTLVNKVAPSVVTIVSDLPVDQTDDSKNSRESQIALGSGFFVDPDGYILTNYHVIEGATKITVFTLDEKKYIATLIGFDKYNDIAVLKIDGTFSALKFADSDKVKVGDWIISIGAPLGLTNTVTSGIISAVGRDAKRFTTEIQLDSSINHGNSGGPSVDMNGKVIGINSEILSNSGDSAGLGFAIPSNTVNKVYTKIRNGEPIIYGYLGINLTQDEEDKLIVKEITKNGPSDSILEENDEIIKFNEKTIKNLSELIRNVGNSEPGSVITVTIMRNQKEIELAITVGKLE